MTAVASPTRRLVHGRFPHRARCPGMLFPRSFVTQPSPSTSLDNPWKLIFSTTILIDSVSLLFCTFIGFLQLRHRTRFRDSFCLASVFKCLFTYLPATLQKTRAHCNITGNTCKITRNTCNITENTCNITWNTCNVKKHVQHYKKRLQHYTKHVQHYTRPPNTQSPTRKPKSQWWLHVFKFIDFHDCRSLTFLERPLTECLRELIELQAWMTVYSCTAAFLVAFAAIF